VTMPFALYMAAWVAACLAAAMTSWRVSNTPGTGPEMWNWQRKGKYTLERFRELPEVVEVLNEIARIRGEL